MDKEEFEKAISDFMAARKRNRQSQWISLAAIVLSAVALITRLVVVLRWQLQILIFS